MLQKYVANRSSHFIMGGALIFSQGANRKKRNEIGGFRKMDLFREYQKAESERKKEIESELIEQHKGLAFYIAKRYFNLFGPDDQEDIRQEAMIALLRAIRNYNPTRGIAFATYAIVVIRNHFTPFLHKKRIACISLDELAADPEKRIEYQEALKIDDNLLERLSQEDILSYIRKRMSKRQYKALIGFLEGHTLQELSERENLSREGIRQNCLGALRKARRALKILAWVD
jgi:RNA polymerase sigma factor (sigma-70 family)